ncbi:hypothetical protein ACHAWF_013100 [Thalassiosira exigua]
MRAEDLKEWLCGIEEEEDPEKEGREGAPDRCGGLAPQKGGGDYRGISLLEPIWKVIEGVTDMRLNVIELHDCLNEYRTKRGTGTVTVEAKLAAQLAYLEQEPFYAIIIDLRKTFDAMERGRCLRILRGYGVGHNTRQLIKLFWALAEMVCRAGGELRHALWGRSWVHPGWAPFAQALQHLGGCHRTRMASGTFGGQCRFRVEGRDAAGF